MSKRNDLSRSLVPLNPDTTLIAVIEMSQSSWLVAGIVPGIERQPLKKLDVDKDALLKLLHRWRDEAVRAGRDITRIAVAYEAGRDGFWLARWLRAQDIEAHVIHASSVAGLCRGIFTGAHVYFEYPTKGACIPPKFVVRFGLSGMGVAPPGFDKKTPGIIP